MARRVAVYLLAWALTAPAFAGGGPLGIDHRLHEDNHGIWKLGVQRTVVYGSIVTVVGGALALGDGDTLGDTFWRSTDALAFSFITTRGLKSVFRRERPSDTSDPDKFFSGKHNKSFPSGEVTTMAAVVTPFIMTYGEDHPAVYALALLPAYDAVARLKVRGHWQTDVIAGAAIGTGFGIWASRRNSPLILSWLPGGFRVGFVHHFD